MESNIMQRQILLWLVIVAVVVAGWLLLPNIFWQYAFFLRIPLLMGVLLLALPAIAEFFLPAMLKNLFVLRGIWQVAFTILGATVAGMAVTFVVAMIIDNAPARFGVPPLPTISPFWYYVLAITLILPTTLAVTDLSEEEIGNKRWRGLFLGISFGVIFLFLFKLTRNFLALNNSPNPLVVKIISGLNQYLVKVISLLARPSSAAGYIDPQTGNLTNANINAFAFFAILLVVYLIVFRLYRPSSESSKTKQEAPALLYVMLLISIATLFLGSLTFFFDYSRVSVLFFWLVITGLTYGLLNVDHFFILKEAPKQPQGATDFTDLLQKRLDKQDLKEPLAKHTLVVVCASGGGIQAAGWTAQVLTGLQQVLGESFTKAIGLISSVSGGSVGAIYYLDRFTDQGFPPNSKSDEIFNSATADSLDAVGWGLAYPDLWRIISLPILPPILTPKIRDRGIALETDWQGEMETPESPKTLADWRGELEQGNIPLPVLNSTLVENGFRLLITPKNFPRSKGSKFFDFNSLYPGKDIDLVTAARLSASFPYVSPICRDNQNIQNYHVADGGYFDNSGFVTGLEWLNKLLQSRNSNLKRILILQINPFPQVTSITQSKKDQGLFMATLGPLLTLFKVRDPILNSRNSTEVELLEQWQKASQTCQQQGVDIQYVPIFFPSREQAPEFYSEQGEYQPPLSWKLTKKEKKAIQDGWKAIKKEPEITALETLWKTKWNMK